MKRSSYHDRDYDFGQSMVTLRTKIGLTQAGLADTLGVSRRAVGEWEAGSSYPQVEHLKKFIALAIRRQAFPAGRVAEEVYAFYHSAHQKVLIDEMWLARLLPRSEPLPAIPPAGERIGAAHAARLDWDEALAVPSFYGREWELDLLTSWVVAQGCRVVSVLGLGGIGKSALAITLMHRVAESFDIVIWRSMRDLPTCEVLLNECLQVLAPESIDGGSTSIEQRQNILLERMRTTRLLLVLDNLEAVLEEGEYEGKMRAGFEGFGRLLRLSAETEHQSCWLLTSREKPGILVPLEGSREPVRALRLAHLDAESCDHLLAEKGLTGASSERARLVEAYSGNPLALKIVAQTIVDLFDGKITPFLEQGELIFGGVRDLLNEQFARLSALEQCILFWLAILREPATLDDILAVLVAPVPRAQLLEAIEALHRHSLIERGQKQGSFTLQSVVLEYLTTRLISEAGDEIHEGKLDRLIEHSFEPAPGREYIRQTQEHLIVAPILAYLHGLRSRYPQQSSVEEQLLALLAGLATWPVDKQGYGPANLVALLRMERGDLRGLNLSRLLLRGVHLQGVEMQDTSLSGATFRDSVFTETFDAIWAVAISSSGRYWAASSGRGEIRVWKAEGESLHLIWQAEAAMVRSLAFSPDGRSLASGSLDGMIQLWDAASGAPLWSSWHANNVNSLIYSPDGNTLASGGNDSAVRFWNAQDGALVQTLPTPGPVFAIAWSPDGRLLASSNSERYISLWTVQGTYPASCIQTLLGHTGWVRGLAFSPDSSRLASVSYDGMVKLWDMTNGSEQQTLIGHMDRIQTVTWSPDGRLLATSGQDRSIWLWEVDQGRARAVLHGHTAPVYGLAFTPDSLNLLSGSDDGTLRVWDVTHGQLVHLIQGYSSALNDLDWSPDNTQILSGGVNARVSIWDVGKKMVPRVLEGDSWVVYGVGWSPSGSYLASSGWDCKIHLWDPATGIKIGSRDYDTFFYGLAWSPDGERLASGTYLHGVLVWEVTTHSHRWIGSEHMTRFPRVVWSPDGRLLAGGGDDGYVYLWYIPEGTLLHRMEGHRGAIKSVAWSPDGTLLASGGGSREGAELFVWDARRGERLTSLDGRPGMVTAVAWGAGKKLLVSGGSDGALCWWDMQREECIQAQEAHQGTIQSLRRSPDGTRLASCGDDGVILLWDLRSCERLQTLRSDRPYERMNITGIRGLTEAQKETLLVLGALEEPGKD